jgi:filamentous hemagglutinin family protein
MKRIECLSFLFLLASAGWYCPSGLAQIRPDGSLPDASKVRRERNTTIITGGTRRGENLFHSFEEFSIPRNQTASFRNIDSDVANIFSRITGSSASRINGLLEALQNDGQVSSANFFLINPNGVLFGRNAALNLGGSFMATTADSIRFADGAEFSAVNPQQSPLLTVSVPVGLQVGQSPGLIRNQSRSNLVLDDFGAPIAGGLQVAAGETLALVGGQLDMPGGYVTAPGGRIELGSVANGEVGISKIPLGWRLNYGNVPRFQNMQFSQLATVNATDLTGNLPGGSIQIQADQFRITGGTLIISDTLAGDRPGAPLLIRANQVNVNQFSLISTATTAEGPNSTSGNIRITTNRLFVGSGGQITTLTNGAGNAGDLTIRAFESVNLDGMGGNNDSPTALVTTTEGSGQGGVLSLFTQSLRLAAGSEITADTSGTGRAGEIQIQADTIDLAGVLRNRQGGIVLNDGLPFPTGIFSDSNATATQRGGSITLNTNRLRLSDGAVVQTNSEGIGDAGDLTIRAAESIELTGTAGAELTPTTIFAASGGLPGTQGGGTPTATGRGGELTIATPNLSVQDGAVIAVSSLNPDELAAGAGSLNIQAGQILLNNRGRLVAESASGNGGNINLRIQDALVLRNNSQVSSSAGVENRGGNGGNITINTDFILAAPIEDSDIRANAFTGTGGNVRIAANGIVGIVPQPAPTNFSDITASSRFGAPGEVIIRSPNVNPSTATPELASAPLSDRPVQGCAVAQAESSAEFFTTGRSGLPTTPYEPLSNSEILADLRLPRSDAEQSADPVVEAQGWQVDDRGAIILVADNPTYSQHCQLR